MKYIIALLLLIALAWPAISQAKEHPARRFEIVFTVSLPLTFLHSFLIVGGIEWLREGSSVRLEERDWWAIGAGALTLSSIVAYYDLGKGIVTTQPQRHQDTSPSSLDVSGP